MNRFYQVLIIVSIFVSIVYLAQLLHMILIKYRKRRRIGLIKEKTYFDSREYYRSYLSSLLPKLQKGTILWIEVFEKDSASRVSLISKAGSDLIELELKETEITSRNLNNIKQLGIYDLELEDGTLKRIFLPFNPKIATDVIYLVFEEILGSKRVNKLKFKY